MSNFMKRIYRSSLLTSVVLAFVGLMLIIASTEIIIAISYSVGAVLIALGVIGIISYIRELNTDVSDQLDLVYGVISIILGAIVIQNPTAIASIIPIVFGIVMVISSAIKINYSLNLKSKESNAWKTSLILSLLTTLCGVLLVFRPFEGADLITKIIGAIILSYAILDIISTISIKRNISRIHKELKESVDKVVDAVVIDDEEEVEKEEKVEKKLETKAKPKAKKKTTKKNKGGK